MMHERSINISASCAAAGAAWLLGASLVVAGILVPDPVRSQEVWILAMLCEGAAVCLTVRCFLARFARSYVLAERNSYEIGRDAGQLLHLDR